MLVMNKELATFAVINNRLMGDKEDIVFADIEIIGLASRVEELGISGIINGFTPTELKIYLQSLTQGILLVKFVNGVNTYYVDLDTSSKMKIKKKGGSLLSLLDPKVNYPSYVLIQAVIVRNKSYVS